MKNRFTPTKTLLINEVCHKKENELTKEVSIIDTTGGHFNNHHPALRCGECVAREIIYRYLQRRKRKTPLHPPADFIDEIRADVIINGIAELLEPDADPTPHQDAIINIYKKIMSDTTQHLCIVDTKAKRVFLAEWGGNKRVNIQEVIDANLEIRADKNALTAVIND